MTEPLIQSLTESFLRFPGIGPRQARRFVYYLLHASPSTIERLISQIEELKRSVARCPDCGRFYPTNKNQKRNESCEICSDITRDTTLLMLVEKDIDLENVLKSGTYPGHFFVLGGLVKVLDKQPEISVRLADLIKLIEKKKQAGKLQEIIAALTANSDGDATVEFVREKLAPILEKNQLKFSSLGRGFSTGVEVEYSDTDTLKNALKNRQ
ncbi:recombination protein RecR [Candidatus Nomurabacteria bacterium]|nr:recombination protein RecR [Candidatus Nomurabacteria bacterium]